MKRSIINLLITIFILFSLTLIAQQKEEIKITTSSEEALSFFLEGRHKYENIQYATAAALFDEAILTDPEFAMAYLYRSRSGGGYNVERKNLEKAVSLIDKVTEGEKHKILFYKAFAEGSDAEQKQHIDFLLKNFPDDKRTHFSAGIYYDFITDYPTALMHYIKATQIDENYAAAFNKIGYCFFDLEYYKAAEETFQKYINLNPDSPNPYDSYAELLLKTGRYEESIAQYKNAYKKDLLFTSALSGIGNNYLFMGDYKSAREYYQKHFRKTTLLDEKIDALKLEAISHIHENNIQNGLETFTQLRVLAEKENLITDAVEAQLSSAFLCIEFNRPEKAEENLNRAEELARMSELPEVVKENYITQAKRYQCLYLIRKNNLDEAEDEITKYGDLVNKRKNPLEIKAYFSLMGLLESEKENYEAALKYFEQADRDDPFNWYYMAKAYQKLGYLETATELIVKISNWNENNLSYAIVKLHLKQ
jgi:tetratricopeptide (TPR) repeat protein